MDYETVPTSPPCSSSGRPARRPAVSLGEARAAPTGRSAGAEARAQVSRAGAAACARWAWRAATASVLSPRTGRNGSSPISPSWRPAPSPCRPIPRNTVDDHRHVLANSGAKRGHRLDRGAGAARDARRRPGRRPSPASSPSSRRAAGSSPMPRSIPGRRDGAAAPTQPDEVARWVGELRPRRHRLPHLHLRHRRRAQGRDDDARQHPRQLPRRLTSCWRRSASATRSFSPSCRCRIPTSIPPA